MDTISSLSTSSIGLNALKIFIIPSLSDMAKKLSLLLELKFLKNWRYCVKLKTYPNFSIFLKYTTNFVEIIIRKL